ncbi:hypothetical protein [Pseudomonas entomophila]|uniref:hypothetical protein n=1 Tax=Pseudomonas entomophila TaxID=312306 RepID=UPI003EB8E1BA
MTIDKQEIKALALACDPAKCADETEESRRLAELYDELTPEMVLELLAEIGRLECRLEVSEDTLKCIRGCLRAAESDIDQLKAEGKTLRKDAERYRWLNRQRAKAWKEVAEMPMNYADAHIDAAMAKEASRG